MTVTAAQPASKKELQTQVSVLNGKIADAQAEIRTWQTNLGLETAKLTALQSDYNEACKNLAQGQNADPEKIKMAMAAVESRITGLKSLIASEQATVTTLRQKLQGPAQALGVMEQADAEDREADEIQAKLEKAKRFLVARNEAQTNFDREVYELRNGIYQSPKNRSNAKNFSANLERLSVGIIN
jgi:peptidoglycan hydrolase CwlO-like protein